LVGCLLGSHVVVWRSKVTWMLSPATCFTLHPHRGHTTHVVSCGEKWRVDGVVSFVEDLLRL
jgi:hypothetical protein